MNDRRIKKINELVKREVGRILLHDFVVEDCLATINRVETANNLRSSRIYLSIMPEEKSKETFNWLKSNIGDIQYVFNRRLRMKPVPMLIFEHDTSGIKMTQTLESIKKINDE